MWWGRGLVVKIVHEVFIWSTLAYWCRSFGLKLNYLFIPLLTFRNSISKNLYQSVFARGTGLIGADYR